MKRVEVTGRWTLRASGPVPAAAAGRTFEAVVPGSVHLDLLRQHVIDDPYSGDTEATVQWVDQADWTYEVRFDVPADILRASRVCLVFDWIDTFATVELNGVELGRCANMHHPQRFDVKGTLKAENALRVVLCSAIREVREEERRLGPLPWLNTPDPFCFARKSAYHFGWDWAPTLVGCGLGRAVVEAWDGARISSVRPLVTHATADRAVVEVHVDLDGEDSAAATRVELSRGGALVARGEGTLATLEVASAALWWPRGYGDCPLYDLTVELGGERATTRTGIRTATLDTSGGAFTLVVNGRPIFCKGANFVPEDMFPTRATDPARYRARLKQACDANMNMLRVWGGGFYESEAFYDACDASGMLVWQDFLFACACYPEEEPHASRVEAEARYQVARLARHPSLVLWDGCNENLWGYVDWGWAEATRGRTWGRRYYFDLLPSVCREVDPSRSYWPGSPSSSTFDPPGPPHPNASDEGNRHVWEEWSGTEHPVIGRESPRFVSEFGFQGPPSFALMSRAMNGAGPRLAQHQKSPRHEAQVRALVEATFGPCKAEDREHHCRQVVQARAVSSLIEWFRSRWPRTAGALFWQLNDAWPAMSWSAVDHDGRKKPLWYAVRRSFSDRLLSFQPTVAGGSLALHWINDTDAAIAAEVTVTRSRFDGRTLESATIRARVEPRSVGLVDVPPSTLTPSDPSAELLVAVARDDATERAVSFFRPDKELQLPEARIEGEWVDGGRRGGARSARGRSPLRQAGRLVVRARSLARDVVLHVDRLDPAVEASDQLLTLLPGEERTIDLSPRPTRRIDLEALLSYPVLQSSRDGT